MDQRRPHPRLVALFAAAVLLAGCSDAASVSSPPASGSDDAVDDGMTIVGHVLDRTLAPVAGANVAVRFTQQTTTTDDGGRFRFADLAPSSYLVDVNAAGFENATLTAEPPVGEDTVATLEFVLVPSARLPTNTTQEFHGFLECAFEAVIISPSCDSASTEFGGPGLFNDTSRFRLDANADWTTLVVDVVFDASASPGLDGMRLAVLGRGDADELGTYEKYGNFPGSESFTVRIEPGQAYDGGTRPVPANATAFELQVYPNSHGYHEVCGLPVFNCTLGAGVAQNVAFDVYATLFYVEAAPLGWSFRSQA